MQGKRVWGCRQVARSAVTAFALGGCASSGGAAAALEPCSQRIVELGQWLARAQQDLSPLKQRDGLRLPRCEGMRPTAEDPLVELSATQVRFDGTLVAERQGATESARERFRRDIQRVLQGYHGISGLSIAADVQTPWSVILEVLSFAKARRLERITFLFAKQPALARLPRSSFDKELAATERIVDVGRIAARVYQACSPALELLGKLSSEQGRISVAEGSSDQNPAGGAHRLIVEHLPGAIARCGCKVDFQEVRAIHWAMFLKGSYPVSAITIKPGAARSGVSDPLQRVVATPDVVWQEVADELFALQRDQEVRPTGRSGQAADGGVPVRGRE